MKKFSSISLLLAMVFVVACQKEQSTGEKSTGTPNGGAVQTTNEVTTVTLAPKNIVVKNVGQNLLSDAKFADLEGKWNHIKEKSGVSEVNKTSETLPNGESVTALSLKTNDQIQVISEKVNVDPDKCYRFSIWIKQDRTPAGSRWFGLYGYNAAKAITPLNTFKGEKEANPYFYYGNGFQDGAWHQLIGYLLPKNIGDNRKAPADATASNNFRMSADVKTAALRFLNTYNKGTTVTAQFALPTISEVEIEY